MAISISSVVNGRQFAAVVMLVFGLTGGMSICMAGVQANDDVGDEASSVVDDGLSGADINALIRTTLAAQGMQATPRLNADRPFLKCNAPLSIDPMFGGWQTVRVKCLAQWQVVVRTGVDPSGNFVRAGNRVISHIDVSPNLTGSSKPELEQTIVMSLARSMTRGETITPGDVVPMSIGVHKVSGVFFQAKDLIGRKLKRNVSAHKPVQAYQLLPNWMVEEDDEVTIQSEGGAITVAMIGLALENGQFGDWVKVQNTSSGQIISGKITGVKKITINPKMR